MFTRLFFEVAYRGSNGEIKVIRVDNNAHGLGKLIKLLKAVGATDVYLESTGDYYYALYYAPRGAGIKPHVLNAYKVRRPEANKTDERDAVWLLKVGESKLFDDSYIPDERVQILRFLTGKKTKIVDRMADSGGRNRSGKPTKKSNKHLRRYMYLAAMAAVRSKNSVVRRWFDRLIGRGKHFKVAIIAVARKLLAIIWHLLMEGEKWSEEDFVKKPRKLPK
ncbi:MAG: IS110 family transposase [Candidatus Njordarchaeia archaeon]